MFTSCLLPQTLPASSSSSSSNLGHHTALDYGVDYGIMVYSVAQCIARIFSVTLLHASLPPQLSVMACHIIGLIAVTVISVAYAHAQGHKYIPVTHS